MEATVTLADLKANLENLVKKLGKLNVDIQKEIMKPAYEVGVDKNTKLYGRINKLEWKRVKMEQWTRKSKILIISIQDDMCDGFMETMDRLKKDESVKNNLS